MIRSLHRVLAEIVQKPYLRRLAFPYFALLLTTYQADANTDWLSLRSQVAQLSPWPRAVLCCGLVTGWSLLAGRALRPVWQHRTMVFLLRQPLGLWHWTAHLLPSLSLAVLPVGGIWWLASQGTHPVPHYLGFLGLSLPIVLGASLRWPQSALAVLLGAGTLLLAMVTYFRYPLTAYVALVVTPWLVRFSVAWALNQAGSGSRSASRRWPRLITGPIAALAWRDLLAVMRTRSGVLPWLWFQGFAASLAMLMLRTNGELRAREAFIAASLLLLLSITPAYQSLEIAKMRLGLQLVRSEWPVSTTTRTLALWLLVAVLIGPTALLIAAAASSMGLPNLMLFILFTATLIATAGSLYARCLILRDTAVGWFLILAVVNGVLVYAVQPGVYVPVAAASILLGFQQSRRGLRGYALHRAPFD